MKNIISQILILTITNLFFLPVCYAQSEVDDIIMKAMKDELQRNITQLTLDKYKPPFYIAYQVSDTRMLKIRATLGSILQSQEDQNRSNNVRLMVGDYSLNDENFSGAGDSFSTDYLPLPVENDYSAIRRAFWIMSDQVYKSALNNYEYKLTALKQQINNNTEKLDDYSRITPVTMDIDQPLFAYDKTKWESIAKTVSAEFKFYKEIFSSRVSIFFINSTVYYTTSEGTQLKYPVTIAFVSVAAETQADDGEPLSDFLSYYALTPDQLPSVDKMKSDIKNLAQNLLALKGAPVIEESYSGPVIVEEEAAAELFASLFGPEGLIASREPVSMFASPSIGGFSKFENKINQRICPENITIKSVPKTKIFDNIPLIGSFEVDAEGVIPKDETVLVEKGILKTLLNDRIPTRKVKESNGHCRVDLFRGITEKAPGVITISYDNGKSIKALTKIAAKEAQKNNQEYFYIVRKLDKNADMPFSGGNMSISRPIAIYKVSVKTGKEQLVRSAFVNDFQITDFKKVMGGTNEQFIYNTLFSDGNGAYPASFIIPRALVFSDLTIEKDKGTRPQKPIVPNPLE